MSNNANFPLHGVTVLDLSRVLAGPYCCCLLGELGASVIKVERPGSGDENRAWGHLWRGVGLDFLNVNRNKRGITVNLSHAAGQEVVRKLINNVDVLVENFVPGTMSRWSLDYPKLREINKRLIYCSISAYGEQGPQAQTPGYDGAVQAFSGHMDITGEADGPPVRTGASVIDMSTGLAAFGGILAALLHRERSGEGQKVALSLLHTALSLMGTHASVSLNTDNAPSRSGSGVSHLAPYGAYSASDGYVVTGALNETSWSKLCAAVGRTDLVDDLRFANAQLRLQNREQLDLELNNAFSKKDSAGWERILGKYGLVFSRINTLPEVLSHAQVADNQFVKEVDYCGAALRYINAPFGFSSCGDPPRKPPPVLGENSTEIMVSLGYTAEKIEELRQMGVI